MLINNVGVIDNKKFFAIDPAEIESLIRVNIFTQTFMTKYARSVMPQNGKKNAIVHLSSMLGENAGPFYAVYSGTKFYNKIFGRLTSNSCNADTLVVMSSGISTSMTNHKKSFGILEPEVVTNGILKNLGLSNFSKSSCTVNHSV